MCAAASELATWRCASWIEAWARRAIGAHLVEAIPRAFEEADRAAQSRSGYRTTVTVETLTDRRMREADAVGEKRRARERHRAEMGCVLAGGTMLAVAIFALLHITFCGHG